MSIPIPQTQLSERATVPPILALTLTSDLARALKLSLFGCVTAAATLWLTGQDLTTIVRVCVGFVALSFCVFMLPDLWHALAKNVRGIASILEAYAEIVMQRDLNRSGAIGDVIQLEPDIKEVVRLVPTNQRQRVIQSPDGTEIPIEDFVEFVRQLETRGVTRSKWISDSASKPFAYKFQSGREMTRELYDAMCDVLEKRARVLHARRKGTSGTLTAKPEQILNILGLD